jgi:hypothetical protein
VDKGEDEMEKETTKIDSQDEFSLFIATMLETCINEGFVLPVHFVAIEGIGALMAGSFNQGPGCLIPTFTVEYLPGERGLAFPFNLILADRTGRVVRSLIMGSDQTIRPQILQ